jgi:hypothetical protein
VGREGLWDARGFCIQEEQRPRKRCLEANGNKLLTSLIYSGNGARFTSYPVSSKRFVVHFVFVF